MTGTNTHGPCVGFTPLASRMRCRAAAGSDPLAFSENRYRIEGSHAAMVARAEARQARLRIALGVSEADEPGL